nr:unnamed protein product [Spirometra erinaceieuropaei]
MGSTLRLLTSELHLIEPLKKGVLGPYELVGYKDSDLLLLLKVCAEQRHLLTTTAFRLPLLGYIPVRRRGRQDVIVTKAICDAVSWADHRLVISKMKLACNRTGGHKISDHALLNSPIHCLHFSNQLTQRPEELPAADESASVETRWCQLRDAVHSTGLGVVGRTRRYRQDWFNGNDAAITNLLVVEKNRLHRA